MQRERAAADAAGQGGVSGVGDSQADGDRPDSLAGRLLRSPIVCGGAAAGFFYLVLLQLAMPLVPSYRASFEGLFCGHPLAYGATILFWIGMAAVGIKWLSVSAEQEAARWKPDFDAEPGNVVATARRLHDSLGRVPTSFRSTSAVQRLRGVSRFVLGRRSASGLNAHLEYLAEFAGEQLHNSYSLVRTVTWAVPILGFLGTVVGITHAIENLDPARLESSFGMVASGLGVAFGTTALSLGLSLVLVFASAFVEKAQKAVLADVELLALDLVTTHFPEEESSASPLVAAESAAAKQLLEQTEALIGRHVTLWESSLDELRARWSDTLARHQSGLEASLSTAVSQTLAGCSESLSRQAAAHQELAVALEGMTGSQQQLAATQQALTDQLADANSNDGLDETLHTLSAAVHLLTSRVTQNKAA